jgi:hypothetical protein
VKLLRPAVADRLAVRVRRRDPRDASPLQPEAPAAQRVWNRVEEDDATVTHY